MVEGAFYAAAAIHLAFVFRAWRALCYLEHIHAELLARAREDWRLGLDFEWRVSAYSAVSSLEMVLKVWRRFPSFYADWRFLVPAQELLDDPPATNGAL
jgi:hypothetical protein